MIWSGVANHGASHGNLRGHDRKLCARPTNNFSTKHIAMPIYLRYMTHRKLYVEVGIFHMQKQ